MDGQIDLLEAIELGKLCSILVELISGWSKKGSRTGYKERWGTGLDTRSHLIGTIIHQDWMEDII